MKLCNDSNEDIITTFVIPRKKSNKMPIKFNKSSCCAYFFHANGLPDGAKHYDTCV